MVPTSEHYFTFIIDGYIPILMHCTDTVKLTIRCCSAKSNLNFDIPRSPSTRYIHLKEEKVDKALFVNLVYLNLSIL